MREKKRMTETTEKIEAIDKTATDLLEQARKKAARLSTDTQRRISMLLNETERSLSETERSLSEKRATLFSRAREDLLRAETEARETLRREFEKNERKIRIGPLAEKVFRQIRDELCRNPEEETPS